MKESLLQENPIVVFMAVPVVITRCIDSKILSVIGYNLKW
jgi:hypothetical protein